MVEKKGGRRVNPSLKAGVSGYTLYRGFSPAGWVKLALLDNYDGSLKLPGEADKT